MTNNEFDVLEAKLDIARNLYNNAVHTVSTYDSFKGTVRDSIRKAGRFEIRPAACYSIEVPLTDEVRKALDIIENVLKQQAEEAKKAFDEFKIKEFNV